MWEGERRIGEVSYRQVIETYKCAHDRKKQMVYCLEGAISYATGVLPDFEVCKQEYYGAFRIR